MRATFAHMPQADTQLETRRDLLPLAGTSMEVRAFTRAAADDKTGALATAQIVLSAGAAVRRYDWYRERYYNEVLVVDESAVNLTRLQRGISLLNTHSSWDLEDVLGVIEEPAFEQGLLVCKATFSRRESVAGYVQDVADGVIRFVSAGYTRERIEMVPPDEDGGVWTYRVVRWTPHEGSLVPIPADMDAQVRAGGDKPTTQDGREIRTFPCEFVDLSNPVQTRAAAHQTEVSTMTEAELQAQRAAQEAAAKEAADKAIQRSADITELCARHGLADKAADFIRSGKTTEAVKDDVLAELAKRDGTAQQRNVRIETVTDEVEVRRAGMEEVLLNRVDPKSKLTDNGRQYRGMTLLELGRDYLESRGVKTRGFSRMQLATEMLHFRSPGYHTTSDFASLLSNVANKRLRSGYEAASITYQMWARRAPNAPDFKTMTVVQLGAAPDLLQTNEHGEFKYGSMTDGKETYGLLTYGRIVGLSRQAVVNDDLRGFDRLVTAFGDSAARLENRTVYAVLTSNPTMADTGALFNATAVTTAGGHANLATGGGSVLQASSLITGRTAMRKQKGLQSEELNIAPAYLIGPAALEQTMYQLTSSDYTPATTGTINEFRRGGRTQLEPIVESLLDANSATAWYLAANSASVDTVEYCFLDGAEGPVIETEVGFDVDGVAYKCREDFAAKAIDFRGLYKSAGA